MIPKLDTLLETIQGELPSRCHRTRDVLENLPDWFRDLGRDQGVGSLERRIGHTIPTPLRWFYQWPATACWLLVYHDTDVFLEDVPPEERPHLVQWNDRPHLVIAELPHSQLVIAVELDVEDPRIAWGDDGAPRPLDLPTQTFTGWLTGVAQKILAT